MKAHDENKIDKLFRNGMAGSENHVPFRDDDWDAMEQLLDERKKKRGVVYLFTIAASGIAAILLLTFGWLYLNPATNVYKNNKKDILSKASKHPGKGGRSGQQLQSPTHNAFPTDSLSLAARQNVSSAGKSFFTLSAAAGGRHHTGKHVHIFNPDSTGTSLASTGGAASLPTNNYLNQTLAAGRTTRLDSNMFAPVEITGANLATLNTTDTTVTKPADKSTKKIATPLNSQPVFALAILSAPDVNGVGSFSNAKTGSDFGLQLSVQLTKRWSVSTGAVYAVKPYQASSGAYKSFSTWGAQPSEIYANCKVLDIPVNVNYQLYGKNKNLFSIGTGLSSYFMLREHYVFSYTEHAANSPYHIDLSNQNKHILGVLNLNATYQRQINSKFGLLFQPYYKLPLTKIGYTQSDLRSAGINVGVNWNINPFKSK